MKINCGDNIKKYRKINDLSQRELADKLGVKFQTVSSWEKNRTEPKIGQIEIMANIFGISKELLVYGDLPELAEPEPVCNSFMQSLFEHYQAASERDQELVKTILGIKD